MSFDWCEQYEVDNPTIDAQHKNLCLLAGYVDHCPDEDLHRIVQDLFKHTREHFAAEEGLMRQSGYPDCEQHAAVHNDQLTRLNQISEAQDSNAYRTLVTTVLRDWVTDHIGRHDRRLATFLKRRARETDSL